MSKPDNVNRSVVSGLLSGRGDDFDPWNEDCHHGMYFDPDVDCLTCRGSGRVTTEGYESYFGANYKPCPDCHGDTCIGEMLS